MFYILKNLSLQHKINPELLTLLRNYLFIAFFHYEFELTLSRVCLSCPKSRSSFHNTVLVYYKVWRRLYFLIYREIFIQICIRKYHDTL
jgi:hypothetical protein